MGITLHDQLNRIRATGNPVYRQMAELVWEYIAEQTVPDLGIELIVRRDIEKLLEQVDRHNLPDDEADETVDLGADLPFSRPAISDDAAYAWDGGGR